MLKFGRYYHMCYYPYIILARSARRLNTITPAASLSYPGSTWVTETQLKPLALRIAASLL